MWFLRSRCSRDGDDGRRASAVFATVGTAIFAADAAVDVAVAAVVAAVVLVAVAVTASVDSISMSTPCQQCNASRPFWPFFSEI